MIPENVNISKQTINEHANHDKRVMPEKSDNIFNETLDYQRTCDNKEIIAENSVNTLKQSTEYLAFCHDKEKIKQPNSNDIIKQTIECNGFAEMEPNNSQGVVKQTIEGHSDDNAILIEKSIDIAKQSIEYVENSCDNKNISENSGKNKHTGSRELINEGSLKNALHSSTSYKKTFFYKQGNSDNISNKLIEHMKSLQVILDRKEFYPCDSCSCVFLDADKLMLHSVNHLTPTSNNSGKRFIKRFKCEECDAKFVQISTLEEHAVLHRPFPHVCHCGVGFYQPQDLRAHKALVHAQEIEQAIVNLSFFEQRAARNTMWMPRTSYTGRKKYVEKENRQTESSSESQVSDYEEEKRTRSVITRKINSRLVTRTKDKSKQKSETKQTETNENKNIKQNRENAASCELKKYADKENEETELSLESEVSDYEKEKTTTSRARRKRKTQLITKTNNKSKQKSKSKRTKKKLEMNNQNSETTSCPVCLKKLKNKQVVKQHLVVHVEYSQRPYPCDLCNKRFTQHGALKIHKQTHAGVKNWSCNFCGKLFLAKSNLQCHSRTHTGEKPYVCVFCNKAFSDQSARKRHERIHTGEKPYACQYCPKKFSDAGAHIRHRRCHENVKDFQCQKCLKRFSSKPAVRSHMNAFHNNIRNYSCKICPKTFTIMQHLDSHMLIHQKGKYECAHCEYRFKTKLAIQNHIKAVHLCYDITNVVSAEKGLLRT